MAQTLTERITRTPGVCGGKACIAGHRVRVLDIVLCYEYKGMTPDEIVDQFSSITLSDVHYALAYYYDHIDEVRKDIQQNDEIAEQFRSQYPSRVKETLEPADMINHIEYL